jgi:hypothetical protein
MADGAGNPRQPDGPKSSKTDSPRVAKGTKKTPKEVAAEFRDAVLNRNEVNTRIRVLEQGTRERRELYKLLFEQETTMRKILANNRRAKNKNIFLASQVSELRRAGALPLKFYGQSKYKESDDVSDDRAASVHLKDFPKEGEAKPLVDVQEEIERLDAKAEAKQGPEDKSPAKAAAKSEADEKREEGEEEQKEAKEGNLQLVAVEDAGAGAQPNNQLANVRKEIETQAEPENQLVELPVNLAITQPGITELEQQGTVPGYEVSNLARDAPFEPTTIDTAGNIMNTVNRVEEEEVRHRQRLGIEKLKEEIRAFHVIYDSLIPMFRNEKHQEEKNKALKSKNIGEVRKHHALMSDMIREYYSRSNSLRVGVIVPVDKYLSGLMTSAADQANTTAVRRKKPGDRFAAAKDVKQNYQSGGMAAVKQQGVAGHQLKEITEPTAGNIQKPGLFVNGPHNYVLNRPRSMGAIPGLRIKAGRKFS